MDAERWLRDELQKHDRGLWVDPSAGAVRFEEYAEEWFQGLVLKPKTIAGYRSLLDSRILPTLGTVELRRINPDLLRAWVAAMAADGLSASRMGQAKRVVSAVLTQAVDDGLIGRNPAETVKVPKTRERDQRYLTAEQVTELADAWSKGCEAVRQLVKLLAYGGLRWGEAVALKSNNVDVLRRRVHVRESATLVNGKLVWGTPKSHRSRTIVIPAFLIDEAGPHPLRGSPRVHLVNRPISPFPELLAKGVEARGGRPWLWRPGAARPATHCRQPRDFGRCKRESSAENAGAFLGTDHSRSVHTSVRR